MTNGTVAISASIFVNPVYEQAEYSPKYCTVKEFEDWYQANITENTVPNTEQVLRLMQGAEAEVDQKEWGTYTQTDEYVDGEYQISTFNWQYVGFYAQIVRPAHINIQRIIRCQINNGGVVSSDPIWQDVAEGPAGNSQFIVLRKTRGVNQLGTSLLFYSNVPYPGPMRFRISYEYGMNLDRSLLREYVGKTVAMGALEMRTAAENINLNFDKGPWGALYRAYKARLKEMREDLFPKTTKRPYIYPSSES